MKHFAIAVALFIVSSFAVGQAIYPAPSNPTSDDVVTISYQSYFAILSETHSVSGKHYYCSLCRVHSRFLPNPSFPPRVATIGHLWPGSYIVYVEVTNEIQPSSFLSFALVVIAGSSPPGIAGDPSAIPTLSSWSLLLLGALVPLIGWHVCLTTRST